MSEKKPKPLPVSKLHPGTEEVAKAMGWSVEVVRLVADLAGCPRVRGGKGKRFVSVEAFRSWFEKLPADQQRSVPAIDGMQRLALAEEVAKLTWDSSEGAVRSLALKHTYEELVKLRDHWKGRDDEEDGEEIAREALAKLATTARVETLDAPTERGSVDW